MKIILGLLIAITLVKCSSINPSSDSANKPKATSQPGEIILVMDSTHWNSNLGNALNETFRSNTIGLPRPESLFTIRHIKPRDFKSILKNVKNIIVVYVLNNKSSNSRILKNLFRPNSIQQMSSDSSIFLLSKSDEWARGQEVLYLFGQSEKQLADHIMKNKDKIQLHFNNIEKERLNASLYVAKELKEVGSLLSRNHGFSLRVPFGWRIEYEDPNEPFIWLRNPGIDIDKNIWVYYQDYNGPGDFDNIIQLRNKVTKRYIFDDKEMNDTSYVVVETIVPPVINETSFKGQYSREMKGLWKTNNLSMGGPFLSYIVADPSINRLYYIDGFIYSPGKSQRESMREIETILWTFSTSQSSTKP